MYAARVTGTQAIWSLLASKRFTARKSMVVIGRTAAGDYVADTSFFCITNRPVADLTLSISASKRIPLVNESVTYTLKLRNQSTNPAEDQVSATWENRLPPNLQFIQGSGIANANGVLTGTVANLQGGQEITFQY